MQTTLINKFDRKFRELERRTGGDPSRVEWLVHNSADIRRLVGTLYFWEADFKRYLFDRTFLEAHSWFVGRYREYSQLYSPVIQRVYGALHTAVLFEDEVEGIPAEDILYPDRESFDNDSRFEHFIPAICGGAEAVEFVFRWVYEMSDGSDSHEELVRGVEAWDYFTETVGVELAGIEARWAKLPRTLVPTGSPDSARGPQKRVLFELLDNAAKAYVFGLPAASMAMCRAVCDMVLRTYCEKGEFEGKSLGRKVIPLAEKRSPWLKQFDLARYVDFANRIMHEADRPLTEKEDETVRQFLETIKTLVERAPARSGPSGTLGGG